MYSLTDIRHNTREACSTWHIYICINMILVEFHTPISERPSSSHVGCTTALQNTFIHISVFLWPNCIQQNHRDPYSEHIHIPVAYIVLAVDVKCATIWKHCYYSNIYELRFFEYANNIWSICSCWMYIFTQCFFVRYFRKCFFSVLYSVFSLSMWVILWWTLT